jgi:hypothetical protein
MPVEEDARVKSNLFKNHEYVTNLYSIEEKNHKSYLYKTYVNFNEKSYPICIAIGDLKILNEQLEYKYVYAVKYNKVTSKLGLYEFLKGSDTSNYGERQLLMFDNYADSVKLSDLVQSKEEYIVTASSVMNTKKNILMDGILNGRYEELKQKLTGHMLNTLNFYNDLFNKGEKNFKDLEFIQSNALNHNLIESYRDNYREMSYNDYIRMILGNELTLLESLDEFERVKNPTNNSILLNSSKKYVEDDLNEDETPAINEVNEDEVSSNNDDNENETPANNEVNEDEVSSNNDDNENETPANNEVNEDEVSVYSNNDDVVNDDGTPANNVDEENEVPANNVDEENEVPANNVDEENEVPLNNIEEELSNTNRQGNTSTKISFKNNNNTKTIRVKSNIGS